MRRRRTGWARLRPAEANLFAAAAPAFAAAVLLQAGCTAPAPPALPLQPDDFALRGVPADIDSSEVRLTFGHPDSIVESPNPFVDSIPLTTWIYDGFEVRFGGQTPPIGYMILAPGERTARGVTVGDPADLMLDLYGEPTTRFGAEWTYADTTHPSVLRVINAVVLADTVRRIYIGWALN